VIQPSNEIGPRHKRSMIFKGFFAGICVGIPFGYIGAYFRMLGDFWKYPELHFPFCMLLGALVGLVVGAVYEVKRNRPQERNREP